MSAMKRREFLRVGAWATGGALITSQLAFAHAAATGRRPRFVLVILRGALDGLAAVPPYGDRGYGHLRGEFALRAPGDRNTRSPGFSRPRATLRPNRAWSAASRGRVTPICRNTR